MNKPKGGLGRGLGALLSSSDFVSSPTPVASTVSSAQSGSNFVHQPHQSLATDGISFQHLDPHIIEINPRQPRKYFDPEALSDLKASILEHGLLQPLVVTTLGANGTTHQPRYELIAGERRLRASLDLGLATVPVIVRPPTSDQTKLELALIENIQRADLNAVEEALAYQVLSEEFSLTQLEIAGRVGKARSTITNSIRLLELDPEILAAIVRGDISAGHARALLSETNLARRQTIFLELLKSGGSVRMAEQKLRTKTPRSRAQDPNIQELENNLRQLFSTKVKVEGNLKTGKISVFYYSSEDLQELLKNLRAR